jgi:serine protease inhibitor
MRPRTLVAAGLALVMLTAACGAGSDQVDPPGDAGRIDVELVGELSDADAAQAARSVNAFGFGLHAALMAGEGGNVVTSPLSVATLLAMVAAGAGGETAQQMSKVLHLDDVRDDRFAALLRAVTDSDDVVVSVANALWANSGTPFGQDYLSFVRDAFGATAEEAPLGDQATADEIDAWVAEHTEGLIEQIAADLGLPDPNAVLVLLNAVYFLGEWTVQFDPELTSDQPFTLGDGSQVDVPTMYRPSTPDEAVHVARREGYELLRLPYGDDERFVMDVYLPSLDHDTTWLIGQLSADERAAATEQLRKVPLDVRLPTFELEWKATLNDTLIALGMELPFSASADFSPMSPVDPFLSTVAHKTYIRVDEKGTEAAAVTGGAMATSLPPSFTVDRPFVFTVTDTRTGTVLFVGTVEDPRG